MSKNFRRGVIARSLMVAVVAGGVLGLAGCQTPAETSEPGITVPRQGPVEQRLIDEYSGRPADRVADELQRRLDAGELPSSRCLQHSIVEHPDGGYHLVCAIPRTAP